MRKYIPNALPSGRLTYNGPRFHIISGGMTQVYHVPFDMIPKVWDFVKDDIAKIVDRYGDRYSLDAALEMMLGGDAVTWIAMEGDEKKAVGITQIVTYPTGTKAARFEALAGEAMDAWFEHKHLIERWARENDADYLEFSGRLGWAKQLKDYEVIGVLMSKDLRGD